MEYYKPFKYGMRIRTSSWQDRVQAFPYDCPRTRYGMAHYRTFGLTDKMDVPKTTTQELYHTGTATKITGKSVFRSEVNFVTYPMHRMRLKPFDVNSVEIRCPRHTTSYTQDYKCPKPYKHKINCCVVEPDPLMNRIPKNDFEFTATSTNKFMDDNFANVGENRKKMNFLRQIRSVSRIFE